MSPSPSSSASRASALRAASDETLGRSAIACVVLAAAVAYAPSLALGWWRDDYTWLFAPVDLGRLFTDVANAQVFGRFRPLQELLSLAIGALGLDARLPSRVVCVALVTATGLATAAWVHATVQSRLAATLAGIFYVTSGRIAILATWVSWWSSQLCILFTLLALLCAQRFTSRASWRSGAACVAASVLALASFEIGVGTPMVLAVIFAVRAPRRPRAWWPLLSVAILDAIFLILYVRDPHRPFTLALSPSVIWRHLVQVADHESTAILVALAAAIVQGVRTRAAAPWWIFSMVACVSVIPGLFHPSPDTYHFPLLYACSAALAGWVIADLARLVPRAELVQRWPVAVAVALALGAIAHANLRSFISREWEIRDSRKLIDGLAANDCFHHAPATLFPLGLDDGDRAIAFMMPADGRVPLSGLCGARVTLEVERTVAVPDDCGPNGYFLTRDGGLVDCPALAESPELVAAATACGVPLDSPSLLVPAGIWSGPRILCVSVPRGEGIVETDPPVVLEGDQAVLRKTGSLTFAVPDDATGFTARLDRMAELATKGRSVDRPALGTVTIYGDAAILARIEIGRDEDKLAIEVPTGSAAVLSVSYRARAPEGPALVLFRPRFRPD